MFILSLAHTYSDAVVAVVGVIGVSMCQMVSLMRRMVLSDGVIGVVDASGGCRSVLEQSLQESKAGTKRKRGDLWFIDPLNPHERKRTDGWPVGLKNVGNTCWFSAVIQVGLLMARVGGPRELYM